MAVFRPFRAFRPLPDYQALIPAPPYDVLTTAGARERAAGNSLSFLHVDKAEIDLPPETDPYSPAVYETGDVIATYVYRISLLESNQFELSTAIGLFNSAVNCAVLVIVNQISRSLGETKLW